jgi:hypothetical protein
MSSIPSISHPPIPPTLAANASTPARGSDGDSTAQEAAESPATRVAEAQNGGSARSKNIVNKTA